MLDLGIVFAKANQLPRWLKQCSSKQYSPPKLNGKGGGCDLSTVYCAPFSGRMARKNVDRRELAAGPVPAMECPSKHAFRASARALAIHALSVWPHSPRAPLRLWKQNVSEKAKQGVTAL